MPRTSHTRRCASSISRSTSPAGRLMNLDDRSAMRVSNSRRSRDSCSASFRPVKSMEIPVSRLTRPSGSRTGRPRELIQLGREAPGGDMRYRRRRDRPRSRDRSMARRTTSQSPGWTDARRRSIVMARARRVPEERPGPVRRPDEAGVVVEGPIEPRLGGVRGQRQLAPRFRCCLSVVAAPGERVGERPAATSSQAVHERVRPVARSAEGVETERAEGRLASHGEREAHGRPDAVDRRQVSGSTAAAAGARPAWTMADRAAGQHLLNAPGVVLPAHRLGGPQDPPGRT